MSTAIPLDPTPDAGARFAGTAPDVLRDATARMNALGIDGDVVHSTDDPEEMKAYLASLRPCDATT
jgi:hypothetical protein